MNNYLEKIQPKYNGYQELHVHTVGSYRDAANTVKDVFDAAEELGRNAVAITDHGNWTRLFEALRERTKREIKILKQELAALGASEEDVKLISKCMGDFGSVRAPEEKLLPYIKKYEEAFIATSKKSIQFIPGVEMYEGETSPEDAHKYHIIFYAKDWIGAQALFSLCNLAQLNKSNDMPRCTIDTMRLFLGEGSRGYDHVIATSACMSGHISSILLQPFELKQEIDDLIEKQKAMTLVAPSYILAKENNITVLVDDAAKLQKEISESKKIANKKYTTAVIRAQAELDKAISKSTASNQLCMDAAYLNDDTVLKVKEKLEALVSEESRAKTIGEQLPKMIDELAERKLGIKEAKEAVKLLEKQNEPIKKLQVKIDALHETIANLPDVYEQAKSLAIQYKEIFGKENFYIELQDHGLIEEYIIRNSLIQIAKETGIPLTVANDVHYKNMDMKRKRDIIATLRWPDLMLAEVENRNGGDQLWFKPNDEMSALFSDVPEAIENTNRIAEKCNVYYKKEMHLPEFTDEKNGLSPSGYLRKISFENIDRRYPQYKSWPGDKKKELTDRIEYELEVIDRMGYSSYISIVEDFIAFAKKTFSPESIGPGRGSGAGSIVCYLTGITDIDPLRYNLIFERFLNPERVSMPDIDSDLAPSIRDKVIDYVAKRYAYKEDYPISELSGTVCAITTEGQLAARSAIRQVGKITGVQYSVCDKIAKLVPMTVGTTLKMAIGLSLAKDGSDQSSAELIKIYNESSEARTLISDALLVEGTPVQTGVHAAGVIIADKPISEYAPMFWNDKKNTWVIQYDMVACESDCGLLKMDFLGLRNLDIIMRTKSFIKKTKGESLDFTAINKADDQTVIDAIYAKGDTDGVFQFESGGMKKTLQTFVTKNIDDVILLNAAYRPGPMQYIPKVTDVKFKRKKAEYIVPEMASILDATYGSPIYQEQIQQIFHEIAGFSLGQADIIRRAMSKKHLDELQAAKGKFIEGFKSKGASEYDIEQFWNELLDFAKYAFNKSHAAAYSIMSYYTAWLKCKYPVEYMAALLSYTTKDSIALYIKDTKDYGITVLGPDINRSIVYTAPTKNGEIRFGIDGIKDVSGAAEKIIEERKKRGPFLSYRDFIVRCCIAGVDKGPIEALIKAGAVTEIVTNRHEAVNRAVSCLDVCRKFIKKLNEKNIDEPLSEEQLYNAMSDETLLVFPIVVYEDDYDYNEMLKLEKEYTGFYVSGHPLDAHKEKIRRHTDRQIANLTENEKGVIIAGHIIGYTSLKRKSDGKSMCKFILEDLTDGIDAICFSHHYERLASQLTEGAIVCLTGNVEIEIDDDGKITSRQFIIQSGRKIA